MQSVLVDGEWLAVALPEGLQLIPHDELETMVGYKYDCLWGARDEQHHMLMTVMWKDSGKILTKLASEKSLAKRVDENFAKRSFMSCYRNNGYFERAVAGASAQAQGFRFSYTVEGVAQEGEVLVFKRGIRCYTLTYYTRSEAAEQNRATYEDIVGSLVVR